MELLKILFLLVVVVIALYRKLPVGITLTGAGILTAILYGVPLPDLFFAYAGLFKSERFIFLTLVVVLITLMGELLRELFYLDKLTAASKQLPGSKRTGVVLLPMLVGLMPMPGGSLVSAPMVGELLKEDGKSPEFLTATNYWFRHAVEFCWPMYPGLILTEAITGMPIGKVSVLQSPMTIGMLLLGFVFFLRKIPQEQSANVNLKAALLGFMAGIWPIVLSILIYGIFRIELTWAVLLSLVLFLLIVRPPWKIIGNSIRQATRPSLLFLIFGTLAFEKALELSGGIEQLPLFVAKYQLPPELLLLLIPFCIGLLTGMISGYVGLGYPLLASFLYQPVVQPGNILLAFLAGYIGMMLSPAHLCLVLTTEYFRANLRAVYFQIIFPLLLLLLFGVIIVFGGWGEIANLL